MDEIVFRILLLMKNNGLDQKTFAQHLGVRPQTITEWKQGVTQSYSKRLHQIANLLGTTVEYLLTGQQERLAPVSESEPLDSLAARLMELIPQLSPDSKKMLIAQLELLLQSQSP